MVEEYLDEVEFGKAEFRACDHLTHLYEKAKRLESLADRLVKNSEEEDFRAVADIIDLYTIALRRYVHGADCESAIRVAIKMGEHGIAREFNELLSKNELAGRKEMISCEAFKKFFSIKKK